jgi:hypothetical protein
MKTVLFVSFLAFVTVVASAGEYQGVEDQGGF